MVPWRIAGPEGWEIRDRVGVAGWPPALTDADGVRVRYDHDADGNVVTTTNALGAATTAAYHPSGMAERITRPDGGGDPARPRRRRAASSRMRIGHRRRGAGAWTAAGRLAAVVAPDGGRTSFEYGTHGAVERVVDAEGAEIELTHDHLERLVAVVAPGAAKWDLDYTGVGRLALADRPGGRVVGVRLRPRGPSGAGDRPARPRHRSPLRPAGRLAEVVDPTGATTRRTRATRWGG